MCNTYTLATMSNVSITQAIPLPLLTRLCPTWLHGSTSSPRY